MASVAKIIKRLRVMGTAELRDGRQIRTYEGSRVEKGA